MDINFYKFLSIDKLRSSYSSYLFPPAEIIDGMLDLVSDDFWTNKDVKILEFPSLNGEFLYCCMSKLMTGLKGIIPDEQERLTHILNNCLYTCVLRETANRDGWLRDIDVKKIFNLGCFLDIPDSNIFIYDSKDMQFYESCTEEKKVAHLTKYDLVIGVPPVDKDTYVDFVLKGYELSKDKVVMLTSAKWKGKQRRKSDEFRECILPYIDKLVYYPYYLDVFSVKDFSGFCYFSLSSHRVIEKRVKSICTKNNSLCYDFEVHSENSLILYSNKVLGLLNKMCSYNESTIIQDAHRFEYKPVVYTEIADWGIQNNDNFKGDYVELIAGEDLVGYKDKESLFTLDGVDKYKVTTSINNALLLNSSGQTIGLKHCSILKPNQIPKGGYIVLRFFDTEDECKSFKTYCCSKLCSFLMFLASYNPGVSAAFFKYIPDQKNWNVVYEDFPIKGYSPDENGFYVDIDGNTHCSLYVKYKLTQEEIDLIESVIKERS